MRDQFKEMQSRWENEKNDIGKVQKLREDIERVNAEIEKAKYLAEKQRLNAQEISRQEIDKEKIIIDAQAVAEKQREEARGQADAVLMKYQAEAQGQKALLEAKASGYAELVKSAGNNVEAASTLLIIEKLEQLVGLQTEAIRNIKIDKVTVWDHDGNGGAGDGKTATANFLSGMVKSLPPLHDVAKMAGLNLPEYLGSVEPGKGAGKGPAPVKLPKE